MAGFRELLNAAKQRIRGIGRGCVVHTPSIATTAPSATLSAAGDFPGLTGYSTTRSTASDGRGPRRASPVPAPTI
jgi:hypothetical protein